MESKRVEQERFPWHTFAVLEVARRLDVESATAGLTAEQAAERLAQVGPNEIADAKARSVPMIFLAQFRDFMIVVLIAAAVISGWIGDLTDALVVLSIVVLNAGIGFVQEYRAEAAIAALKRMAASNARVLREGRVFVIPARELVPGDVVLLEVGDAVPADLRLVEAVHLKTDEAALTGESVAVDKTAHTLSETDLPLGDRRNILYKGTLVTYGRGRGITVATGVATELGRIATLLHDAEETRTPLQKRLARFGRALSLAVIGICAIVFAAGLLRGVPVFLMLLTAISLAVAAIPEALPAVVSISLALGARRMVARHVLVRKLPAVETLGSVTHICSDKTGTLTENRMRVEELVSGIDLRGDTPPGQTAAEPWATLYLALALSNDAHRSGSELIGDPTEAALLQAAEQAGFVKSVLEGAHPRIGEIAFDSERARMTTLHRYGDAVIGFTKGAPEGLLPRCDRVLDAGGPVPIRREPVESMVQRMAQDGLRVLAVAMRLWAENPEGLEADQVESQLVLLGLIGLMDPPRPEVTAAVALCRDAGITPIMITGDHPETAAAIARRLGILCDDTDVMRGRHLARLNDRELAQEVARVRVYARVAPEQKIRIVKALQAKGEFVAMTGDGVNDAPALKSADIGIAMGVTGTDVAKEAAHMVLLDDNFASIVSAVREGRRIYDNIRKFIKYVMTGNAGEIWTIFLAPFLGLPIPLLPIHILWINLVTDGLPGLALAVEPEERGVMQRPPRPPQESIFAHGMWQHMIWVGLLMGGVTLFSQAWTVHQGNGHWQTMVFTVLTLSQLGHVLAVRSERDSLFAQGVFSNKPLIAAVAFTTALQMAVIYVPWFNAVFKTQPLRMADLAFCLALSSIVFFAVEVEKGLVRRGWLYGNAVRRRSRAG
jgi:Ca2+-transporting ATPase